MRNALLALASVAAIGAPLGAQSTPHRRRHHRPIHQDRWRRRQDPGDQDVATNREKYTGDPDLYGAIVFYDGRPSQMQVDRTAAIGRELADVVAAFDAWSDKDLASLNADLGAKKLQPIVLINRAQWEGVGKGVQ